MRSEIPPTEPTAQPRPHEAESPTPGTVLYQPHGSQPAPTQPEFRMQFTSTARGARLARRLAVQRLDDWGYPYDDEASQTAALLVGELAANAVRHGHVPGRDFALRLAVARSTTPPATIRIEVSDARGESWPVRPAPVPASTEPFSSPPLESGRGLLLVEALATRWGVADRVPLGKTVWAELDTPAAPSTAAAPRSPS